MEFNDIKKIWDSRNKELFYSINANALHNRILSKKKRAQHITNFSELLLIIINSILGLSVLVMNLFKQSGNIFLHFLSAWMFGSALYMLVSRIRRIKIGQRFDRSMQGDLDHAISMATYQVRLSVLGRWNILPIGLLTFLGLWEGGKPVWLAIGTLFFFAMAYYAGGWEHNIYKGRKRELEILKKKLDTEELSNYPS